MIRTHFTLPCLNLAQKKTVDRLNIPSLLITDFEAVPWLSLFQCTLLAIARVSRSATSGIMKSAPFILSGPKAYIEHADAGIIYLVLRSCQIFNLRPASATVLRSHFSISLSLGFAQSGFPLQSRGERDEMRF
jgi:hypothetical protein